MNHSQSSQNKPFWTEFFALYENLPAVWDMRSEAYKDRKAKLEAYDLLADKLREIEPNADRDEVVRKINIFRTNYRREISRINTSKKLGGRVYRTSLWYFNLLSFLRGQEVKRDKRLKETDSGSDVPEKKELPTNDESDTVQEPADKKPAWNQMIHINKNIFEETEMADDIAEESSEITKLNNKRCQFPSEFKSFSEDRPSSVKFDWNRHRSYQCAEDDCCKNEPSQQRWSFKRKPQQETSADILAKSWSLQYSEMSDEQKIYARKAIADILFEGCLGNLRRGSMQINESKSQCVIQHGNDYEVVVDGNHHYVAGNE